MLKRLSFSAENYRNSLSETLTGTVAGSLKSFEIRSFRIVIADIRYPEILLNLIKYSLTVL